MTLSLPGGSSLLTGSTPSTSATRDHMMVAGTPWATELFLAFRSSALEREFKLQLHRSRCKFDILWGLMTFASAVASMYKCYLRDAGLLVLICQYLFAASWLVPYPLQLWLSRERYVQLRSSFHMVHYCVFVAYMYIMTTFNISTDGHVQCSNVHTYLGSIVLHSVNAWIGRQIPFGYLLPLLLCSAAGWGYMLLRPGGICQLAMACGMPKLINSGSALVELIATNAIGINVVQHLDRAYGNTILRGQIGSISVVLYAMVFFVLALFAYWLERRQRDLFLEARRIPHISFHGVDYLTEACLLCFMFCFCCVCMLAIAL